MTDALRVPIKGWAKATWNIVSWHAGEKDKCWPSLETLAMEVGCCRATLCAALSELERLKLITRSSSGGGKSTTYYVHCSAAQQFTVQELNTKEREAKEGDIRSPDHPSKTELDKARTRIRRASVKSTFLAFCEMYPEGVTITVPMLAKELGMRPAQLRSDMLYIIRNLDVPLDKAVRFGTAKRKPWRGPSKNVVPFRQVGR
jgi:DNA-binding transcriptional MocR family regulator